MSVYVIWGEPLGGGRVRYGPSTPHAKLLNGGMSRAALENLARSGHLVNVLMVNDQGIVEVETLGLNSQGEVTSEQ